MVAKMKKEREREKRHGKEGDELEMIEGVYMKCIGFVCLLSEVCAPRDKAPPSTTVEVEGDYPILMLFFCFT